MSEFDKGYLLGMGEAMVSKKKEAERKQVKERGGVKMNDLWEKAVKKLTTYCAKGKRQQNIVSFIAGSIVSAILIILKILIWMFN